MSTICSDKGGSTEVHNVDGPLPTLYVMLTPCPDPALVKFYKGLPFLSYVCITVIIL
jgi:hypothetical protein